MQLPHHGLALDGEALRPAKVSWQTRTSCALCCAGQEAPDPAHVRGRRPAGAGAEADPHRPRGAGRAARRDSGAICAMTNASEAAARAAAGRARYVPGADRRAAGAAAGRAAVTTDLYLPALPGLAAELQSPMGSTQLTLSALLLAFGLSQLLLGPMADRFGRRPVLLEGCRSRGGRRWQRHGGRHRRAGGLARAAGRGHGRGGGVRAGDGARPVRTHRRRTHHVQALRRAGRWSRWPAR